MAFQQARQKPPNKLFKPMFNGLAQTKKQEEK